MTRKKLVGKERVRAEFRKNPDAGLFDKPKFIVFEGIDGSGKSTLIKSVHEFLHRKGQRVLLVHQPGTTNLGVDMRNLLKTEHVRPQVAHLLIEACRMDLMHFMRDMWKLDSEIIVLSDRHVDSTFAYQGAVGIDINFIDGVQSGYDSFVCPDLTIFLAVDEEVAETRRKQSRGDSTDVFDNESINFFKRVSSNYKERIFRDRSLYYVVDANQSEEEVSKEVISFLEEIFNVNA
jgi:dTMP kinase